MGQPCIRGRALSASPLGEAWSRASKTKKGIYLIVQANAQMNKRRPSSDRRLVLRRKVDKSSYLRHNLRAGGLYASR